METLLTKIRACGICAAHLPLGPNPIVTAHPDARVIIIGQAPGTKVHKTSIPWDDPSGRQLRKWLDCDSEVFYDPTKVSLVPMGFCYPGKGKTGDLPPRPECAPEWHEQLLAKMPNIQLIILIGMYAQKYYLKNTAKKTLTETVRNHEEYAPKIIPLPHPSPRNRFWLTKNPWFDVEVVPKLQSAFAKAISE
ncbi:uracil-DNA glycosylase family protein [uncultured Dokdonia sp.]|uniref:uracil-DNA glycosylase family protein n=1 Tax=uncultured Dokdonia sp. TaxID=575653 RepID=UPI00263153A4|nr:uracil-DNA glycosylase family protein [uncultured Dokdonia sp.]